MLEILLSQLAKRLDYVKTLTTQKINKIVKVDSKGIYVETEASKKKFQEGRIAEPYQLINKELIKEGWEKLVNKRTITSDDLGKAKGRSSFLMAFFSVFPFVEVRKYDKQTTISLKTFITEDLPCQGYHNVLEFLEEVKTGKYNPKELSKQTGGSSTALYVMKSDCRQDLRILGFVNKENEKNTPLLNAYSIADNKEQFIAERLLEKEYFQIVLFCLDLLKEFSKEDKKGILIDLGMLIVKNSRGDNWMVKSVARDRTHNLLKWLENTKLIDEEWRPYENFFDVLKQKGSIKSNIRGTLLKIMIEYLAAKREDFGKHVLKAFVENDVPKEYYELPFIDPIKYIVTASVGKGSWAYVPWIAIMNKKITNSIKRGFYICYLFSEDMRSVYLVFMQGVTDTPKQEILRIRSEIRHTIPEMSNVRTDDNIYLGTSKKAIEYAFSTAAYKKYKFENMPTEQELVSDLKEMVEIYENYIALKNKTVKIEDENQKPFNNDESTGNEKAQFYLNDNELLTQIHSYITSKGFFYNKEAVVNLYLSLKTKPFVILSGISGTGKTRIARLFAESVGANDDNGQFTLIPIRPDWHDSSDLLGYRDIKGDFKEGPLTKVIKKAVENPEKPYFVLLDEMNLARVEHYFSDILSVMETRDWQNGEIVTNYLFPKENEADEHDEAWKNLRLPNNLYIIGTVNMDETTHPFSKKVLDRANTIEFNEVDLSNLAFLHKGERVESIPVDNDHFASKYLKLKDIYEQHQELIERTTKELVKINEILKQMYAHVGYRVRDEICLYLVYNAEGELLDEKRALDYCILQKILPRISGSDSRVVNVLKELYKLFTGIQYHEGREVNEDDLSSADYPHSARKVAEMLRRFEYDGFTSFWIS